jgi:endonuclease/exonuclease/phosphatase family metal-dependent hydrolase
VAAATTSSFTIAAHRAAHAHRYVVFASLKLNDIIYANLSKHRATRKTASSSKPRVTIRGLKYTTATYYYRVETKNGSRFQVSDVLTTHLAPPTPARVRVVNQPTGLALTWGVAPATAYDIVQATDPKLQQGRATYQLAGQATAFTPYGLHPRTTYYFRVRARNGSSASKYSPVLSATFRGGEQPIRVLTYNVLHKMFDGTKEGGNTIAPWSRRMPAAAALIKSGDPDVMSINEASDYVVQNKSRAIDTLADKLGNGYTLAHTEPFPNPLNPRTGNYIIYKNSTLRAVGAGGYHAISNKNWVAYQALASRATGATFLFVSVHLSHGGNSVDSKRASETRELLSFAHQQAQTRSGELPIIFAGDFNSYSGTDPANLDSPERLMRAGHVADSLVAAQSRTNTVYGSVNNYTTVPSKSGRIIDHVFGTPGVAVHTWKQLLNLTHGHFAGVIPSDHNPVVAALSFQY